MKLPFFKKENPYHLDGQTAEQMLENIFRAADREPNNVPLKILVSYSNYRKERFALQRSVIVIVLLFFLMLPLFFVPPHIVLTLSNADSGQNPLYEASVTTRIPLQEITAIIRNRRMPLYEAASHQYIVQPNENGSMVITAKLLNRQVSSIEITVTNVDVSAPTLLSTDIFSSYVRLYVEDENGIDYESVRIVHSDGTTDPPRWYNGEAGYIDVDFPTETVEVTIPDTRGNELYIALNPAE